MKGDKPWLFVFEAKVKQQLNNLEAWRCSTVEQLAASLRIKKWHLGPDKLNNNWTTSSLEAELSERPHVPPSPAHPQES